MVNEISNEHSLKLITFIVLLTHLLILCQLSFWTEKTTREKSPKRLTVQTIKLNDHHQTPASAPLNGSTSQDKTPPKQQKIIEEKTQIQEVEKKEIPKETPPKPTPKPVAQKTTPPQAKETPIVKPQKAAKPEKIQPKSNPSPKPASIDSKAEELKAKQRQLLEKAQESIAKINQNRDKINSATFSGTSIPNTIQPIQIEALENADSGESKDHALGYREELVSRLKLMLRLPELGEVIIKLTLERSGSVAKIVVINAESEANRKYIETTLPMLSFPGFGKNFDKFSQNTFLISLSNDL